VSSCSRSTALAIKTPCTHRCWRGQEKYIRQRVCAAAFGRNSCLGYRSSSSSSVCCVRLSVRALLSSDGRSAKEPTVDPSKSRRSIPTQLPVLGNSCHASHFVNNSPWFTRIDIEPKKKRCYVDIHRQYAVASYCIQ
jgi:hypothetical protein